MTSSNDAIMEVKLKRADFLYTHRKPTPAPVPMVSETTTTIVTPPPSSNSSPVVTKTEMIEEEGKDFTNDQFCLSNLTTIILVDRRS